jgi:hypothetical protein
MLFAAVPATPLSLRISAMTTHVRRSTQKPEVVISMRRDRLLAGALALQFLAILAPWASASFASTGQAMRKSPLAWLNLIPKDWNPF